jgi:hypothetical protein
MTNVLEECDVKMEPGRKNHSKNGREFTAFGKGIRGFFRSTVDFMIVLY